MERKIKFEKNLKLKRIIFCTLFLIVAITIFKFSAQQGEKSSDVSGTVAEKIVNPLEQFKSLDFEQRDYYIDKLQPYVRKLAHFTLYMIVGFSVMGFLCTFDIRKIIKVLCSYLVCFFR